MCVHKKTCPQTLILEHNGDAYPCDFFMSDEYKAGNVGTDSLDDILSSVVYKRFLGMKPTLPHKCKVCKFQRLCHGGCPRNRRWGAVEDDVDVDYFFESYLQVYSYAHERMEHLAKRIKTSDFSNT